MVLLRILLRLLSPLLLLLILIPQVILNECHRALGEAHGLEHLQHEDVGNLHRILAAFRYRFCSGQLGKLALLVLQLGVVGVCEERVGVDAEDREGTSDVEGREEEGLGCTNEEEVPD